MMHHHAWHLSQASVAAQGVAINEVYRGLVAPPDERS
jgi:hypothetical protein